MTAGEAEDRFKATILRAFEILGIASSRVRIAYESYLQDYEVIIDGDVLTDEQIAGVREATRLGGVVTFTDIANRQRRHRAEVAEGAALMKSRALELRRQIQGLPVFDRARISLADFSKELEIFAGMNAGSALFVPDEKTLFISGPGEGREKFGRLCDAITASLGDRDDIEIMIIGHDAE